MKISTYFILTILVVSCYSQTFLSEEVKLDDSLTSKLLEYKRENLTKIALACEKFIRDKQKLQLLGGLHDYIDSLDDQKIRSIILDFTIKDSELANINKLEEISKIEKEVKPDTFGEAYLNTFNREKIEAMALECEKYSRKKKGQENLLGGLHDYIRLITKDRIVQIIIKYAEEFPELKEKNKLEEMISSKELTIDQLKERLYKLPETKLAHMAVAADEYDRRNSQFKRLGGLKDYIWTLDKPDIINAILRLSQKWVELRKEGKLENLEKEGENNVHIIGGFADYIFDLDDYDLKKSALACEKYDRDQRNIILLGGLHDYIDRLSTNEIIKLINEYLTKYPKLQVPGFLENLSGIYKGGYNNYLNEQDEKTLRKYCIAIEHYDAEKRGSTIFGGISDYVNQLKKEDLIKYIKNKSEYYPYLRGIGKLEKIAQKY